MQFVTKYKKFLPSLKLLHTRTPNKEAEVKSSFFHREELLMFGSELKNKL